MLGVIPGNVFLQISWWRLLLAGKIAWCSEYDICFYFSFFSECFAVTAELNNGSIISLKECYIKRNDQDICGYTTACNRTENMTGAVSPFKRCEAKCCSTEYCNKYLVPDLIPLHSHTQSGPESTRIALTAANTTKAPESGGINIEAFCLLSVLLLFGIQMTI